VSITVCAGNAQTQSEKAIDIATLLRLTSSSQMGLQLIGQMIQSMKLSLPSVPAEFWETFNEEAERDIGTLIQGLVPVYDKHFTHTEIQGLIEFYKSPLGKKLLEKQPIIMKESYQVGEQWGEGVVEKMQEKLQEKGLK
jgi:hypothetical protein